MIMDLLVSCEYGTELSPEFKELCLKTVEHSRKDRRFRRLKDFNGRSKIYDDVVSARGDFKQTSVHPTWTSRSKSMSGLVLPPLK